jgi:hypothetical protein
MKLGYVYSVSGGMRDAKPAPQNMTAQIPADLPVSSGDIVSFYSGPLPFEGVSKTASNHYFVRRAHFSDSSIYARATDGYREFLIHVA